MVTLHELQIILDQHSVRTVSDQSSLKSPQPPIELTTQWMKNSVHLPYDQNDVVHFTKQLT